MLTGKGFSLELKGKLYTISEELSDTWQWDLASEEAAWDKLRQNWSE